MTKKEKAIELIKKCNESDIATISAGVYLETGMSLQEDAAMLSEYDTGKMIDYGAYPYWITTNDGLAIGIMGADDPDLLDAIE